MSGIDFNGVSLTIDYTDRDFLAIVVASRNLVTNRFPHITDFNTNSQVEMIIELFAATFDRLMFMQDKHAGETNIVTARRRQNIINLGRSIGYNPATQKAAIGTIKATLTNGALVGSLTIPKGTLISTKESQNPQRFRLTQDMIIAGGSTFGTGPIKNSLQFVQEETSDLSPNQAYVLEETPFLDDGSIVVKVNSLAWTEVQNFLDSSSTSKHYLARIDDNDVGSVIFGDGVNGQIPIGSIEMTYETGGGLIGNQAVGTITENATVFSSDINEEARITWTNESATAGGDDRETEEQIRTRAPRNLAAPTRTITRKDFQTNVEDGVAGVVRAIGFSSDQDILLPENHAFVYIVPTGGGAPSPTLIANTETFLTTLSGKPIIITMDLTVLPATYKVVTLKCKIYVDPDVNFNVVKGIVTDNLLKFFDYANKEPQNPLDYTIDFGKTIRWSRLVDEIQSVLGVNHVQNFEINTIGQMTDLTLLPKEIPELDDSNFDTPYLGGGLEFILDT